MVEKLFEAAFTSGPFWYRLWTLFILVQFLGWIFMGVRIKKLNAEEERPALPPNFTGIGVMKNNLFSSPIIIEGDENGNAQAFTGIMEVRDNAFGPKSGIIIRRRGSRAITPHAEQSLTHRLKGFPPEKVELRCLEIDPETEQFSIALKKVFEKANWSISKHTRGRTSNKFQHIELTVPESKKDAQSVSILFQWMMENGLRPSAVLSREANELIVLVGPSK